MNSTNRGLRLSEKALRIFFLHYYSADWIRNFLWEQRFKTVLLEQSMLTAEQREADLLLCLKASTQLYPTARGLKEIDSIVRNLSRPSGSSSNENSDSRFAIFNKNFCIDTRYRMSLLVLADNARECRNDTLASLWVIAATAKLDHVSAWQAYAAAKEEESRILGHTIHEKYWQSQKSYVGDVKEKIFDATLFSIHYYREFEEKEAEFRRFLRSKVDQSLYSTIDTCDLKGSALLRVYCNVKAHEFTCSNRLWTLVNDLYGKNDSFPFIKQIISCASQLEDLVEVLQSTSRKYRLNCRNNSLFSSRWIKASKLIDNVVLKLKLLIDDQLKNAEDKNDRELEDIIWKITTSLQPVLKFLCDNASLFAEPMHILTSHDSSIQEVINAALPILTSHTEEVFPDLMDLLQTFCQDFKASIERYIEVSEEIVKYHFRMLNPPDELMERLNVIREELKYNGPLFHDRTRLLHKFFVLFASTSPLYDQKKNELYLKLLHSFADSNGTINTNQSVSLKNIPHRTEFLQSFDEVFSIAVEASKVDMYSDINLELMDMILEIINYSKVPEWNCFKLFDLLKEALVALKAMFNPISTIKRLDLIEIGKEFREASKLFVKGEELRRNSKSLQNQQGERMLKLADLYSQAVHWTEQVAGNKLYCWPEPCLKQKVKCLEAIKAFERGDEEL